MAAIETPCTTICTVDPGSGLCIGCGRTLPEIAAWISLSEPERRRIMAELPQRMLALDAARAARPGIGRGARR